MSVGCVPKSSSVEKVTHARVFTQVAMIHCTYCSPSLAYVQTIYFFNYNVYTETEEFIALGAVSRQRLMKTN
jgi:hypothetical protein